MGPGTRGKSCGRWWWSRSREAGSTRGRFGDQAENPEGKGLRQRTMGYTGLLATGDDSFIIAYDQFDYPDPSGKPCKTILVRHVRVRV